MLLLDMGEKLRLYCRKCGLRRQYDVQALAARFGNPRMPGFKDELALRNGCKRIPAPTISDQCGLKLVPSADDPAWTASRPPDPGASDLSPSPSIPRQRSHLK